MASKLQIITEMFNHKITDLTDSQDNWKSFLKTAANNYKYSFPDQVLIYAQKPDATACAEIELWNDRFGRWVNKGAAGIALLSYDRLRYVFDVSDTNSFYGNEISLWKAEKEYDNEIMAALSNAFGETDNGSFESAIFDTATNLTENNLSDYVDMLRDVKLGSFLEELDKDNISVMLKNAVASSVGYMLMTRCGIDADAFYDFEDFIDVVNFNTHDTVIALGTAVSDISEYGLREIESTVKAIEKKNRTFDKVKENMYDEVTNAERSKEHGTDNIQTGGRLSNSEYHNAETGEQNAWQIRHDEKYLSSKSQESALEHSADQRRTYEPSTRDRHTGERNGGTIDQTGDEITKHNGKSQGNRSDEMGTTHEQHSELGRGNSSQGSDLQLSNHDFDSGWNGTPYFHQDKEKNELIKNYLAAYKEEIAAFFEVHSDREERSDFVMSFFNSKPFEMTLSNGVNAGFEVYYDAIRFWRGNSDTPESEAWERWFQIEQSVFGMILLEQWTEPNALLLPSVDNQVDLLETKSKEDKTRLHLPQAAIDYVLCHGSGVSEGKMRIYRQFSESLSKDDNIRFLKKEYGMGGHSDAIPGTGYWEDHDVKGIRITDNYTAARKEILLSWQQVEKRISELIKVDRYLNPKEKEMHPQWLEKQGELESERTEEKRNREVLQTAPPEQKEYIYEYHLGDSVYIGADEYSILSFDESFVKLSDVKFPLFSTEMPRAGFDMKVKENPANEHLRVEVKIEASESKAEKEVSAIDNSDLISKEITIDDHKYVIESIGKISGDVSMRDVTFENGTGFPINRVEKIEHVKTLIDKQEITTAWKQQPQKNPELLQPTVPESEKHNYRITDENLGTGGAKEKFRNNMAAINLLHELEFENRLATPEEQEILSKYVGFGGLADAFDETKDNWKTEFTEMYTALSPKEYSAARESTLTAFYTPPVVIRSIYQTLENMGFKTGNILEPSCGVGNFMGLLPDSMQNSKFYGVELDSISGRIAKQLYQTANIAVQGYETTALPDSFFDVAISNVPFGQFKVSDKKYDKNNWLIHDYFFGKTLDKVRPGGVIAFITSSGTMDKKNSNVRKYIAQRAELLGAIRLPNNTFKANAGTEVTSDILFLQKRDTLTYEEPSWVHLGIDSNGHEMNQYFIDNPDMVLGEMVMESSQFGQSLTCKPYENRNLSDLLSEAIQNIHAEFAEHELSEIGEDENLSSIPADPNARNFSYTIVDGKVYYRENSRMNPTNVSVIAMNRIKGMIEIRDCVRNLIALQTEDYPDEAIKAEQEKLNTVYDKFIQKYGLINSRANKTSFSSDSSYCLLCSLEILDENGELKRKADMFTKRTIKPNIKVTAVSTASEALAVSIGEKACVDMDFMQKLTGKTEQELFEDLKGVIFLNPQSDGELNRYVTADEYLSGNVRKKLELAKRTAELYPEDYSINVEMLEKVQPKDLNASEISVRLGTTWLPESDIQTFIFETLQTPRYAQWNIKVHYSKYTAEWNIENKSYDRTNVMANATYGTDRINAYKIIEETLNLKDVRIFDYVEDSEGNRKPVLNKKETAIAQGKQELIKQAFQDWIWQNPERRQRLKKKYNELFNSERAREYDGSHIKFSGMNPEITLRPHQINAVARIMYGGNTLLAHVVGAGKTFEIVAAAQESKRLGLCNKSLIVVPNHLTEQWASEYLQLYPSANILVATKKDFKTKNRKKFCARIAMGDYDAVIIGHSQFEKIPLSTERQQLLLRKEIDEITQGIAEVKYKRGERFTVKQLEKTKKSLQAKLDKLNDQTKKDDVITFEELGVDRLFVDEAHSFKNLFLYSKMRNVGGIAQTEAQKSSDLYMKCRYLDEITGSKGVIFATGTPVSNSMVELYTMQRYLQYETLVDKNLQHFDSWASTFGETVTAIELAPEGTGYRTKTRFAKFYNLPELMMMFRQVADIQTADMLKLPVPNVVRKTVTITPSDMQKELVSDLANRAEKVRNKMVDSSVDNMLLITNDGRKLALDQRLSNDMLPDDPNGKVATCANNVYEIWERTTPQKSAQLIFCDLSTPHNDGKFNVYDDIKKKLIAKGIPENEISFIHNADSEAKKKELFAKVRSGQVRVLIGSTFKMGAGTNVQKKLIAEHHLDCPWRPADLERAPVKAAI